MRGTILGCVLLSMAWLPAVVEAATPSPALTDREIAERLTRMETRRDEGLKGLREEIGQLRTDMMEQNRQLRDDVNIRFEEQARQNQQLRTDMMEQNRQLRDDVNIRFEEQARQNQQLRTDMMEQNRQLRDDVNIRFEEHFRLMLGILAAFVAIVAINISIVVWDRRTAARPFEDKVTGIAEELAEQRSRVSVLLEAFRALGQQNQTVAAVLKRFNLL